jgi:hypothetical protein
MIMGRLNKCWKKICDDITLSKLVPQKVLFWVFFLGGFFEWKMGSDLHHCTHLSHKTLLLILCQQFNGKCHFTGQTAPVVCFGVAIGTAPNVRLEQVPHCVAMPGECRGLLLAETEVLLLGDGGPGTTGGGVTPEEESSLFCCKARSPVSCASPLLLKGK